MGSSSGFSLSLHIDLALLSDQGGLLDSARMVNPVPNSVGNSLVSPFPTLTERRTKILLSPHLVVFLDFTLGVESKLSSPE